MKTVAVWLRLPDVPVIVKLYVPTGVAEVVLTVKVELAGGVMEGDEKDAVVPPGKPLTVSATVPLNPPCDVVFTVYVVLPDGATDWTEGVATMPKSGFSESSP
jgi:hypothetical protein